MQLLDRSVSTGRDRVIGEYAAWMGGTLNTRADLTLRCRATVELASERRVSMVLNEDLLRATVVRALNRVNGYALGVRRSLPQPRIDALVWSERGGLSGRPHVHALIERPGIVDGAEFAGMLERAWRAQPFGYDEVEVEAVRDIERSIAYNAKESPAITGNLVYFHKERSASAWWRGSSGV